MATVVSSNSYSTKLISIRHIDLNNYLGRWFTLHNENKATQDRLHSPRRIRQTHVIGSYPCRIYLVEYDQYQRIRIWLNENEARVNKCSDYMYSECEPRQMQSCWVCKWVDINSDWLIDPLEEIDEATIDKPDFYRLHGDQEVEFGDGGYAFLIYPVWIHEHLPVSHRCQERGG